MSEPENPIETGADSGVEALRNEVQTLRAVVSFAVLLMFVFSVCVNVFLFRQATAVSGQAAQAEAVVSNFDNMSGQATDFWLKLNDYARTHPDFQPIIAKYSQLIGTRPKK
jgi:hypothetical protein